MPHFVVAVTQEALNRKKLALSASKILLLGVAYKPNVDDCRESPAFPIMSLLRKHGASVQYHDPFVMQLPRLRHWPELACMDGVPELSADAYKQYDAIIIHTKHSCLDLRAIQGLVKPSCVIIDTSGELKGENVFQA